MLHEQIRTFETLQGQLESLHEELTNLSKKSPGDLLNSFKLKLVNKLLDRANVFLGSSRKPMEDFTKFEDEDLPSNSDVLIVTSQYLSALEDLRSKNIMPALGHWFWVVKNGNDYERSDIRTAPPKKIAQKK